LKEKGKEEVKSKNKKLLQKHDQSVLQQFFIFVSGNRSFRYAKKINLFFNFSFPLQKINHFSHLINQIIFDYIFLSFSFYLYFF